MTALCATEDHLYVVVNHRPWWRWFRKTMVLRCWHCDLRIEEPA